MEKNIRAIYKNGIFQPIDKIVGISNDQEVNLSISTTDNNASKLKNFVGIIDNSTAIAMLKIIEEEFETVNMNEWEN